MKSKSKKWLVIAIVSLVLFAATVVCTFLFILPAMQKNKFFKEVKAGNAESAQEALDKLSGSDKKEAIEMVEDLIVKETNNYLSGKKDYDDLKKLLITVENIKDCWGMTAECFGGANAVELEKIYDELVTLSSGSSEYNEKKARFQEVFNISVENTDPESTEPVIDYLSYFEEDVQLKHINGVKNELEAKLQATYDGFKAGTVSEEKVLAEADMMIDVVYSNKISTGLAYDIKEELKVIGEIRDCISDINTTISNSDYNAAINKCKDCASKYGSNQYYAEYKSQVEELQKKAYDEGLTFYKSKFDEFTVAKDKAGAQALYDQIKDNYADAFNIDEILGGMKPEWADTYIAYLKDYEKKLKTGMDKDTAIDKIISTTSKDYAKDSPVDFALQDVDGNGTPELIIMGDLYSHIITYKDGKAVYVATTGVLATTATPATLVSAFTYTEKDKYAIEAYVEFKISGSKIEVVSSAYGRIDSSNKQTFTVNGEKSDYDGFVKAGNEIIAKYQQDMPVAGRLDADYETVINNYKE